MSGYFAPPRITHVAQTNVIRIVFATNQNVEYHGFQVIYRGKSVVTPGLQIVSVSLAYFNQLTACTLLRRYVGRTVYSKVARLC